MESSTSSQTLSETDTKVICNACSCEDFPRCTISVQEEEEEQEDFEQSKINCPLCMDASTDAHYTNAKLCERQKSILPDSSLFVHDFTLGKANEWDPDFSNDNKRKSSDDSESESESDSGADSDSDYYYDSNYYVQRRTKKSKKSPKFYVATEEDFEYFLSFYGTQGFCPVASFNTLTFEEFKDACQKYQEERRTHKANCQQLLSPFYEFRTEEKYLIRDQLLYMKGLPIIGNIFSLMDDGNKYRGREHMINSQSEPFVF
jgi:hypothetical protein